MLREADTVVAVGWTLADELRDLGAKRVEVMHQRLRPRRCARPARAGGWAVQPVPRGQPHRHAERAGSVEGPCRRCADDPEFAARFVLRFVGPVDHTVLDSIAEAGLAGQRWNASVRWTMRRPCARCSGHACCCCC